jgi:hypothetical protein
MDRVFVVMAGNRRDGLIGKDEFLGHLGHAFA